MDEERAGDRKLRIEEAAEMAGLTPGGWRSMVSRTKRGESGAPEPDGWHDRRTPWWWASTVAEFNRQRRPRGRPRSEDRRR